jgi:hypothetical protein
MTTELVLLGTAGAPTPVAGYDNTTIACIAPINLTSVDQAGPDMGRQPPGCSPSVWTAAAGQSSPPPRPS